jgi:hypothetical protein
LIVRELTGSERDFLSHTFGSALDLTPIRVGRSLGSRSISPFGARIHLSPKLFENGSAKRPVRLADPRAAAVFAHEAVHVWQRQRGRAVTREGAWLQLGYSLGLLDPYAYDRSARDGHALLAVFVLGNIEQQGKIIEDYVFAERTGGRTDHFRRVVTWVRLSGVK